MKAVAVFERVSFGVETGREPTEVHVDVFDFGRDVPCKAIFKAAANSPAGVNISLSEEILVVDCKTALVCIGCRVRDPRPRNAALGIEQDAIPGITDAAGEGCVPMVLDADEI